MIYLDRRCIASQGQHSLIRQHPCHSHTQTFVFAASASLAEEERYPLLITIATTIWSLVVLFTCCLLLRVVFCLSFNINTLLLTEKLGLSSSQSIYNLTGRQRANDSRMKYITATVVLLRESVFVCGITNDPFKLSSPSEGSGCACIYGV